jgi:dTDP-3-amino-3,4,6-trideoxy-alpha-D-glucose transaminase
VERDLLDRIRAIVYGRITELSPTLVPANDFKRQWEDVSIDALAAVDRVGRSGWLVLGDEVKAFEHDLAGWWGFQYAVGVANGLDALEIGLRCAGIASGDRVLTTPLTAFATTLAILRAGAQPVYCDVDATGGLDLELADHVLRGDRSIRFLMPVHLYGHPLDAEALRRLVDERGIALIEDCAQSAGAERDGAAAGRVGLAAAVSLYPTKNLGAMGDGGALLTDEPDVAQRARTLRDYGQSQSQRYVHTDLGLNSRLDELHAAILRSALLPRLDGWLARRRVIAARYADGLAPVHDAMRPIVAAAGVSAHHLFPVEVLEGDPRRLQERLVARGIAVGRHYPRLCPDQVAAQGRHVTVGELSVARRLAERELSLPINPYLTDAEVDSVIEACLEALA